MGVIFTGRGRDAVLLYIKNMKAKQKEIVDAGIDSIGNTKIPTLEEVKKDILSSMEDDGVYYEIWGVTQNYLADTPLFLEKDKDFIITEDDEEKMDKTIFKTKRVSLYFSTLQIGCGISFVPDHKGLYIQLLVFELEILFGKLDEDSKYVKVK